LVRAINIINKMESPNDEVLQIAIKIKASLAETPLEFDSLEKEMERKLKLLWMT